jgi:demethylmenaquinone methyltransferase / 2-methoxy-6-polyprenyl-1,4-benzoquinol methylase
MTPNEPSKQAEQVRAMFTRIAGRYDLMNRLMSFGQDVFWRRKMMAKINFLPHARVLDLGAGTGDLSREVRRLTDGASITAADFTLGMLQAGKEWQSIQCCNADAMHLPFEDNRFDVVVSGFLVRNVENVDQTLTEMARVLKPGGQLLILDMTRPRSKLLAPFIRFYLNRLVPLLGTLVTGQKDAYTYLPDSTQSFLKAEDLATKMKAAGLQNVEFETLNFGTVAIHRGNLAN